MNTTPEAADEHALGRRQLALATNELRGRVNPRAVEVADGVLAAALRASRRSLPIRALPPHDHIWVSDQVLISQLRQEIDDGVSACSVGRVFLRVEPDATLKEVTIELFVQYGEVLMDAADRVRAIADLTLANVLGKALVSIEVVLTHVHVSDVTVGDPHLVDPSDEVWDQT